MSTLSAEQVKHVAELAKLQLSDEELQLFAGQLSAVLDYAAALQRVDTSHVSPTATVLPLRSVMREDVVRPSLPTSQGLTNAPERSEDAFRVHAVLEGSQ
ncbi:MAG: Asp-tRNA(Asn)/Glu-tRNA(Gln) amidotransferase subunit GatC [Caldilineales bacterium]|nr:Asp-tRNA(Asn)/Glu-tRNA(Gln) amidotransferase subunit GatC [Caldilineales bacterium]